MIIATTENVLLCERDEKLTAFWELKSTIRGVTSFYPSLQLAAAGRDGLRFGVVEMHLAPITIGASRSI